MIKQTKQGIDWSKKTMFDGIRRPDLKKIQVKILEDSLKAQMDRELNKWKTEEALKELSKLRKEREEISDNKIRSKYGRY